MKVKFLKKALMRLSKSQPKIALCFLLPVLALLLDFQPVLGQEIKLVKDIRVKGGPENSGTPERLARVGNEVFFVAYTHDSQRALWKSDGTSQGTVLVKDIASGQNDAGISNLFDFNGRLVFSARDSAHGLELWGSDGTEAGTFMIKDINTGTLNSQPSFFTILNNTLFFRAIVDGSGTVLVRSDGTEQGTEILDFLPGARIDQLQNLTVFKNELYFTATTTLQDSVVTALWKTDGTSSGTERVRTLTTGMPMTIPVELTAADSRLYFVSHTQDRKLHLWVSEGDSLSTFPISKTTVPDGFVSYPNDFCTLGDQLYFVALDKTVGRELWTSDGTSVGTKILKDIYSGPLSSGPFNLTRLGNQIIFSARDHRGMEIWTTDGTEAGTKLVHDLWTGSPSGLNALSLFTVFDDKVFFRAENNSFGTALWSSDGTTMGTRMIKSTLISESTDLNPTEITALDNQILFSGDSRNGRELWGSNGTSNGTKLVKDINDGPGHSYPSELHPLGNRLFFAASDENRGKELWVTEGTEASTQIVKDINTRKFDNSHPQFLTSVGNNIYFRATDSTALQSLWITDGTEKGTKKIKFATTSAPEYLLKIAPSNKYLFFEWADPNSQQALWKADGATCTMVYDLQPRNGLTLSTKWYEALGSDMYFVVTTNFPTGPAAEIWKSDGTTDGTRSTGILSSKGLTNLNHFQTAHGFLYFVATGGGHLQAIWRSDGTLDGTTMVSPIDSGSTLIAKPVSFSKGLYFFVTGPDQVREIWKTNGTQAGTERIIRLDKLFSVSIPIGHTVVDDKVYFVATSIVAGHDLWVCDGTAEGTRIVRPFGAEHGGDMPKYFTPAGSFLYFVVHTDGFGRELWRTDGTPEGTIMIEDLYPGIFTSNPRSLTPHGNRLYFSATTPETGEELFYIEHPNTKPPTNEPENELVVFPNPAKDYISISGSFAEFAIYDVLGRKVMTINKQDSLQIPVSWLTTGIYFLRGSDGQSYKFIKE